MDPVYQKLQDSLPLLPGNNFDLNRKFLPNFRKSHAFDKKRDISIVNDRKPGIGKIIWNNYVVKNLWFVNTHKFIYNILGGIPLPHVEQDNVKSSISAYPKSDGSESIPAWIAFDRKVIRFNL